MKLRLMPTPAVGALGLLLTLSLGGAHAQTSKNVAGGASGASVKTASATLAPTPSAVLPAGGGIDDADAASVSVPGLLTANALSSSATGIVGENAATAQGVAGASGVNILNGLITAKSVVALASSSSNGRKASSNPSGSTIAALVVNGVPMGTIEPAPNTTINIPGVGAVILKEVRLGGDGVRSSSIQVNMIHVVLKDALTGTPTGDIIVGSAQSAASFAR